MSMRDIIESVKEQLSERVASPFWGAFALSWLACNYPVFVYMFSSASPYSKIQNMSFYLAGGALGLPIWNHLLPVLVGAAYVYGYPWIARKMTVYTLEQARETKKEILRVQDVTPLTPEEVAALRKGYEDRLVQMQSDYDKQETRVASLTRRLESSEKDQADATATARQRQEETFALKTKLSEIDAEAAKRTTQLEQCAAELEAARSELAKKDRSIRKLVEINDHFGTLWDSVRRARRNPNHDELTRLWGTYDQIFAKSQDSKPSGAKNAAVLTPSPIWDQVAPVTDNPKPVTAKVESVIRGVDPHFPHWIKQMQAKQENQTTIENKLFGMESSGSEKTD